MPPHLYESRENMDGRKGGREVREEKWRRRERKQERGQLTQLEDFKRGSTRWLGT